MPDARRPRVLVITRNLPPLVGGMEKLNHRMILGGREWADVAVVGPCGCRAILPTDVVTHEATMRPLGKFLSRATTAGVGLARRFRPDIVIAGSGVTAPMAWLAARSCRARSAVYVHGLDLVVKHPLYQRLWLPAIRRCDLAIANSGNTRRLAIERGVDPDRIKVLHPGTDLPRLDPEARTRFRERFALSKRPVLLSVGRLTARKGLPGFVLRCLPAILAARPDTVLAVIGDDPVDALQRSGAEGGRAELLAAAAQAGVPAAVRLLGPCDDATLGDAYQGADLHVFPVCEVPGDVEGFGMVAIEAAAHGLPTIGFRVGGVPDAIVEGSSGSLVEPADYAGFAAQVDHWLACGGQPQVQAQCVAAATAFGWDRFSQRLHDVLCTTLGRPHESTAR